MSQIKISFNKASTGYDAYAYLQKEIATRLDAKLDCINVNPVTILDLGAGTGLLTKQVSKRFPQAKTIALDFAYRALQHNPSTHRICADSYQLPLTDACVDVVISNLMMQWCPDLDTLFNECHRVLKNDGLLLFSTFGTDTLKELKKSWSMVDSVAHVNTFIDMHDIGDQLLKNSFQNPVMETEMLTLTYANVTDLLRELKAIGAQHVTKRSKSLTGKHKFQQMIKMYESYRRNGKLPATYEVIYGHAWKETNTLNVVTLNTK